MGTKHHNSSDPTAESKRRRRVGFSNIDTGIEPKECIKIFLVSGKDEVDSPNSFQVEPTDLNQIFEDDGKIYGYKGLKITVWLSSISFHAYADISFESTSDGGRGITNLKSYLQNIFGENLVEGKDDFLQTFSTERHYIKSLIAGAELLSKDMLTNNNSGNSICHLKEELGNAEIFRIRGAAVGQIYSRLIPLVLLLIEGSNPVDVTDPRWEIYVLVQKDEHKGCTILLAFAVIYRFHRYPEGARLRLGQILTIPPYQRKGHCGRLLKLLNHITVSEDIYDLTIEEPVGPLQHVRTSIDVRRLLAFDPIHTALDPVISRLKDDKKSQPCRPFAPPANIIEDVRKILKINRRQFVQCWEILIYLGLSDRYMENYTAAISSRVRADFVGRESEGAGGKRLVDVQTRFDGEMSFAMFKCRGGGECCVERDESEEAGREEQLRQLVDDRVNEIKSIAEKVSACL